MAYLKYGVGAMIGLMGLVFAFTVVVAIFAVPLYRTNKDKPTRGESSGIMILKGATPFNYSATNSSFPIEAFKIKNAYRIDYNDNGEFIIEESGYYVVDASVDVKFFNDTSPVYDFIADFLQFRLTINGTASKKGGKSFFYIENTFPTPDHTVLGQSSVSFHAFIYANYGDRLGLSIDYANFARFGNLSSIPPDHPLFPGLYSTVINVGIVEGDFLIYSISLE